MSEAIIGQGIISAAPKNVSKAFKTSLIINEQEYLVQPKGAGADFVDLIGSSVKVKCLITEANEDEELGTIFVKSYEIIDDLDDLDWFGQKE